MQLHSNDIREDLKVRVPTLRSSHFGRAELWTEKPVDNYAIFGEILRPYLFGLLRSPGNDGELRNIFSFLEEIARKDSAALLDALQLEIIIPLAQTKTERDQARKYMGTRFKQLIAHSRKQSVTLWFAKLLTRLGR